MFMIIFSARIVSYEKKNFNRVCHARLGHSRVRGSEGGKYDNERLIICLQSNSIKNHCSTLFEMLLIFMQRVERIFSSFFSSKRYWIEKGRWKCGKHCEKLLITLHYALPQTWLNFITHHFAMFCCVRWAFDEAENFRSTFRTTHNFS